MPSANLSSLLQMASDDDEPSEEALYEIDLQDDFGNVSNVRGYVKINIPYSETKHLDRKCGKWLLDFLKASASRVLTIFRRTVGEREAMSLSVTSTVSIRHHFHINFIRKINCASLTNICKEWIKHPMNIALLIWLVCVAVSASMLGLLLLGLLDKAFPTRDSRDRWIEINNQILNALFTLLSLYQHPNLFHHLFLLCRWRSQDIVELRKVYCKNGAYRPREWAHMMVLVLLLHITCFSQYFLCGLYWGYSSNERPILAENVSFALGTIAPIIAGIYAVYSPLGREFASESDEELHDVKASNSVGVISKSEWVGEIYDCRNDITVGCLSFFCTFCVFGWNMERIGFGNMYVHAVTFFLLCVAPFWIFSISALKISDGVIRDVFGVSGLVLCVFGLLYGGFWRIRMRERFGLPGSTFCCGSDTMSDYVQWVFCSACSLAQEVRTMNFYDIEDDDFHKKNTDSDDGVESGSSCKMDCDCSPQDDLVVKKLALEEAMAPPFQPSMQPECSGIGHDEISQPNSPLLQPRDNSPVSNGDKEIRRL